MGELMSVHLRSVQVFLSRALSEKSEALGLKSGSISALSLISANPGISQNEVGLTIGTDRSTMVNLIDTLEERSWVVREKSNTDRRRYFLHITNKGQDALNEIISSAKQMEDSMLEALPFEDMKMLRELLKKARAACLEVIEQSERSGKTDELYRRV
ncbi:MAG: MarR family winged helix-turn-helix transcriptional regulator [Novosphingobium sp.]